ncbi:MAG: GLPGLI family protein [Chitinophagaceae bacterium]|nr:MAG: GLPGLI family protein [Chitinophagaceae bacterium]
MKKLILPLFLLIAGYAQAQQQGARTEVPAKREGTVTYERVMQMRLPANMPPEVAARIPKERTDVFELLFGNDQSLWRIVPVVDGSDATTINSGGGTFVMRQAGNNDESYFNFTKGERLDKRELFDNDFIVVDTISRLAWKLSEETKVILGHTARKATAQRIGQRMAVTMENGEMKRTPVADTATIVAWYTTAIPVSVGPQDFQGQLPGLILELDVNNGRQLFQGRQARYPSTVPNRKRQDHGNHAGEYAGGVFDQDTELTNVASAALSVTEEKPVEYHLLLLRSRDPGRGFLHLTSYI